jgi:hypothetical protein
VICTKVIDATSLLGPWWTLRRVLLGDWQKFLGCIEFGLFVQKWRSIIHPITRFYAQCVAAITLSSVQEHDDRWSQLASGPMGAFKYVSQDHLKQTDSILLASAISIVRQTIQTYSGSTEHHQSEILGASSKALESLRRLDVGHTFPDLQREFCAVWNQLVDLAQNDDRLHIVRIATATLKNTRNLYIELHKGTCATPTSFSGAPTDDGDPVLDDAGSYRKCDVGEHRPSQPIAELRIEEPAPEVTTGDPPTPVVSPGTIAVAHPQAIPLPASFLTRFRPASSFPHPTPGVAPIPLVGRLVSTLPVRQPALIVPFISGAPNEGVFPARSLSSSGQAR